MIESKTSFCKLIKEILAENDTNMHRLVKTTQCCTYTHLEKCLNHKNDYLISRKILIIICDFLNIDTKVLLSLLLRAKEDITIKKMRTRESQDDLEKEVLEYKRLH